jgi:hypothetical protein
LTSTSTSSSTMSSSSSSSRPSGGAEDGGGGWEGAAHANLLFPFASSARTRLETSKAYG